MKVMLLFGGAFYYGGTVGLFCWNGNASSGSSYWNIAVHTYHKENLFSMPCFLAKYTTIVHIALVGVTENSELIRAKQ